MTIGPITAPMGERASGMLPVPAGVDPGTSIPITIVHGARPGPVLALVAGIHGSEYAPIIAMQRILPLVDARELRGTLLIVHAANLPAFFGRTIYTGPIDGKNLNRSFPGRPDGTVTERQAHVITREILRRADYVVDIHAGDGNEALRPYTGYYARHGTPEVIARSREMAVAFGLEHIVLFPGTYTAEEAIYTGAAAVTLGKPALDIEAGQLAEAAPEAVDAITRGSLSLMRHLRMLDGAASPAENPVFIEQRASVKSLHDGIFYPAVAVGEYVTRGARIGHVTDLFGRRLQEVHAPEAGIVLVIIGTPPVRVGETLATIAQVPGSR
jgi:predicted deacylase